MRILKKIWRFIMIPVDSIIAVAVLWDESKRMNLDGSWDRYHEKRNERMRNKNV